jgi:hypothetical protein
MVFQHKGSSSPVSGELLHVWNVACRDYVLVMRKRLNIQNSLYFLFPFCAVKVELVIQLGEVMWFTFSGHQEPRALVAFICCWLRNQKTRWVNHPVCLSLNLFANLVLMGVVMTMCPCGHIGLFCLVGTEELPPYPVLQSLYWKLAMSDWWVDHWCREQLGREVFTLVELGRRDRQGSPLATNRKLKWVVNEADNECIQNFGEESSWKPSACKTGLEDNIRLLDCEDGRWMKLAQDRNEWRALVLTVLNLRILLPWC